MSMREDCKQYESRSYPNGETVRKCNLDLAPEAPWRCPQDCTSYERRRVDVNWSYGTLVSPPAPKEPKSLKEGDSSVAALLDEAEDIVNRAGPAILAELEAEDIEQWANSAPRGMRPKHRKRRRLGKLLRRQRKK